MSKDKVATKLALTWKANSHPNQEVQRPIPGLTKKETETHKPKLKKSTINSKKTYNSEKKI